MDIYTIDTHICNAYNIAYESVVYKMKKYIVNIRLIY